MVPISCGEEKPQRTRLSTASPLVYDCNSSPVGTGTTAMGKSTLFPAIILALAVAPALGLGWRSDGSIRRADDPQNYGHASLGSRADPSLAGYLGAFFLGSDPYVYFYLSNGNNALSFKALNRGAPVMKPTKGTRGVRDPALVAGGGPEAGKKWYIIGTDLDIGKARRRLSLLSRTGTLTTPQTSWNAAVRTGSRGIFVWESTDLVNWVKERLVVVEDATAGMVWAPEAIWDPEKSEFPTTPPFLEYSTD